MTDATAQTWQVPPKTQSNVELPAPVPFSAPVLISDCVTPLVGETILSLLLKRLDDQP